MFSLFDLERIPRTWRVAYIPKKSGGKRKLTIPNDELKELQTQILQYLYELRRQGKIKISAMAHGFVPYHDCMSAVMVHDRNSEVILCCDIEHAFDTLNPDFAKAKLLDAGVDMNIAENIIGACSYENALPQGGPASPYLLNIAMFDADCQIAAYAKKHGFVYTRYADDMQFSVKDCDPRVLEALRRAENKEPKSKNPFVWFLYGVDTILQTTLGMRINHKKDHVIFRGSKCKPHILGICIRQDGHGYNAERRFREETRAGICNLYRKVIVKQKGRIYDTDWRKWACLEGRVNYMDKCRRTSDPGYDNVDPRIQDKFYQPLERKFNAAKLQRISEPGA